MDDDLILPAVGDGLSVMREFIELEIKGRFPGIAEFVGSDSVWLSWPAQRGVICTSDSFIVDPVIFPGGDLGTLTVAGIVNDLLCSGGWPEALMLNLLIGPLATRQVTGRILDSIASETEALGVRLIGGDTKYLDLPGLTLATSGFGLALPRWNLGPLSLRRAAPGDVLICTGTLGDHAVAVLSAREGLGFERVVTSDCAPLARMVEAIMDTCPVTALHDLTRGGLGGALFELSELSGCAVEVSEDSLPVASHVRAACEMLGLDPLFLANEGKMLIIVGEEQSDLLLRTLAATTTGRDACLIGRVAGRSEEPKVLMHTHSGEMTLLKEPESLPAPRLC